MDKAVVIFFEEDKYNTVFDVLFSDLREDPDVFFVTEKSFPKSRRFRRILVRRNVKPSFNLSSVLCHIFNMELYYSYYELPKLLRKLSREYSHISVLMHNSAVRKPKLPLMLFKLMKKKASFNLLYLDVRDHLWVCEEANYLAEHGVFDKIFTIDPVDAEKYNMILCRTPYSRQALDQNLGSDCQMYFCGNNAGRMFTLYSIWKAATEHGVTVEYDLAKSKDFLDFFQGDEHIRFIDHISYDSVLKNSLNSTCILDITQKGQSSLTLRPYEAVVYNKKLLTNNENIKRFQYYDERYMKVFQNVEDIDWDWLKEDTPVDYDYKGDFSPKYLLKELE